MVNKPAIMHLAMLGAIAGASPAHGATPLGCFSLGASYEITTRISCMNKRPSDVVDASLEQELLRAAPDLSETIERLTWIEIRFDDQSPFHVAGSQPDIVPIDMATSLTDSPFASGENTSAIPEPKTWALLLLGLGAIGFTLRRPQKVSSFV